MRATTRAMQAMTPTELRNLPPAIDLATAARALGLGRTKAYELARANALPVKTLRLGKSYRVVTADLLRVLGADQNENGNVA